MLRALRFRLYPNHAQEERMLKMIEAGRWLWNDALAYRNHRWEQSRQSTSYNLQAWILSGERATSSDCAILHSQAEQDVLRRLDKAFKAFFEHRAQRPRFKRFSESGSFTYPQAYRGSAKPDVKRKRLFLSKIGNVRVVFHRSLPSVARIKTCTITREPSGHWFASLVYEELVPLQDLVLAPRTLAASSSPIGVDLGLKSLIVTSGGEKIEHPRFLRRAERRLKHLQKGFSRKKNSINRRKAQRRLAAQHSRIADLRRDFNHKLSTRLVREHWFVAFEDLRVKNMIRNHKLTKSIQDAGWGQLVTFAEYKAQAWGSMVVRVPAAFSTQECAFCGMRNNVSLGTRTFACHGCNRWLDRDMNAANIVLKRGIAKVGQDVPKLKPVEVTPLLLQTTGATSVALEAGTTCSDPIREGLEFHGSSHGRTPHTKSAASTR
jgi:putative transposase